MPTTYTHDLFGKKVYHKLPNELKDLIKENGNIFRIGLFGPDILFYNLFDMKVVNVGKDMHGKSAAWFFERGMARIRKKKSKKMMAYLLGFACHYILDSKCHSFIYQLDESGVISHTAVEKELDRYLMEKSGLNPYSYYPAHIIRPKVRYARTIHKLIPEVSTDSIMKALRGMKFYTKLMVHDDGGKKRFLVSIFSKIAGKENSEMATDFFMAKDPVPGSRVPVAHLVSLFKDAVEEAPDLLVELYQLLEEPRELSERWNRTYNG